MEATGDEDTKTITIPGGSQGITLQDEGYNLGPATTLNFVGSGVKAENVDDAGKKKITISGGSPYFLKAEPSANATYNGPSITIANWSSVLGNPYATHGNDDLVTAAEWTATISEIQDYDAAFATYQIDTLTAKAGAATTGAYFSAGQTYTITFDALGAYATRPEATVTANSSGNFFGMAVQIKKRGEFTESAAANITAKIPAATSAIWTCPETGLYKMDIRVAITSSNNVNYDALKWGWMRLEYAEQAATAYTPIAETYHIFDFNKATTLHISEMYVFSENSTTRISLNFDITSTTEVLVYGSQASSWNITRVA